MCQNIQRFTGPVNTSLLSLQISPLHLCIDILNSEGDIFFCLTLCRTTSHSLKHSSFVVVFVTFSFIKESDGFLLIVRQQCSLYMHIKQIAQPLHKQIYILTFHQFPYLPLQPFNFSNICEHY